MDCTAYRVAEHDEQLCIVAPVPAYNEPIMHTPYWPIGNANVRSIKFNYPGIDFADFTVSQSRPGEYRCVNRKEFIDFYAQLVDWGRTLPIRTDKTPIPKPARVKLEMEYRVGKWWKLTKAKGWVPA